mmetsp:Transcript_163984/g.521355  ORF Transcript_163984/g.521355 Transcript_163984/m.521355 type:complete len:137 (+) Transcript_163984:2036-2446(+)
MSSGSTPSSTSVHTSRITELKTEHKMDIEPGANIELDEEQFIEIIEDDRIQSLMQDLGVAVFNLQGLFSTFDGDDSGKVTLQELMEGIMKLRGEPQKTDVIGCWVSTRLLHEKIDNLSIALLERNVVSLSRPISAG